MSIEIKNRLLAAASLSQSLITVVVCGFSLYNSYSPGSSIFNDNIVLIVLSWVGPLYLVIASIILSVIYLIYSLNKFNETADFSLSVMAILLTTASAGLFIASVRQEFFNLPYS